MRVCLLMNGKKNRISNISLSALSEDKTHNKPQQSSPLVAGTAKTLRFLSVPVRGVIPRYPVLAAEMDQVGRLCRGVAGGTLPLEQDKKSVYFLNSYRSRTGENLQIDSVYYFRSINLLLNIYSGNHPELNEAHLYTS
jgi:hypothetical protein